MEKDGYRPLLETKAAKGRTLFQLYAVSVFVGICFMCIYRVSHIPAEGDQVRTWAWMGLYLAELWFFLYWILTLFVRWNLIYRCTFIDRLSRRYEKALPGVDIFVCTADPKIEPPIMVINTVLSVMAYDYPPEKLSVYLSDDGGSELTFYALLEASHFSKLWLPFCNKFNVEPRSPGAYFSTAPETVLNGDRRLDEEWSSVKKLYEEMKKRIETSSKLGKIPQDIRKEHSGFREWDLVSSQHNHQTILQILINGKESTAVDIEGQPLPTLVYLAREKRPQNHHNFKAGAMNALIRVSSRISNGSIILNVDCDMYSNNSESIRDALCFFMDEERGREIAYIQFSHYANNLTKNDIYGNCLRVIYEVEHAGFDANGGSCYIGSGCFHRRETLCGKRYSKDCKGEWKRENETNVEVIESVVLEETCKVLASCTYEDNTEWGKEMGLKYGCPVEDMITGLSIQCRGWKSVYFKPERKGFVGVAPTTLLQTLIQHKRWSEGNFQIFLSSYCPFLYGHKRIPLKLQFSYCVYFLWAANCLATLYYVAVPSLCILRGISLFPEISGPWVLPFAYVFITTCGYSYGEFLWSSGTSQGWWNDQRIWMFKRTTSYLFGFFATILKQLGFTESTFVVTAKVTDEDVSQRYEQEVMEFGTPSPMFTILATLALLNLFCLAGVLQRVMMMDMATMVLDPFALQISLCLLLVLINLPVYKGLFFRKDNGSMPTSVTYQSIAIAVVACSMALY